MELLPRLKAREDTERGRQHQEHQDPRYQGWGHQGYAGSCSLLDHCGLAWSHDWLSQPVQHGPVLASLRETSEHTAQCPAVSGTVPQHSGPSKPRCGQC